MKLIELEIQNIRGIHYLKIKPDGKNMVIWGPNGSGKSSIVDALDFLFTGQITRLSGEGTGNISLAKHGPHIQSKPEKAFVRGLIQLPECDQPLELSRFIANPNKLICDDSSIKFLKPILDLAQRGQHVLTRREILQYITSDGSTRARKIQNLLNLGEIEVVRNSLYRLMHFYSDNLENSQRNLNRTINSINSSLNLSSFDSDIILGVVNENRAIFGAPPINDLKANLIKKDINLPKVSSTSPSVNLSNIEQSINQLRSVINENNKKELKDEDDSLRNILDRLRSNPELQKNLNKKQLINLGISEIDDTGSCPLCETLWPEGELKAFLLEKAKTFVFAEEFIQKINRNVEFISQKVDNTLLNINRIIDVSKFDEISLETNELINWKSNLESYSKSLEDVYSNYLNENYSPDLIPILFSPNNLQQILDAILNKLKQEYPVTSPEQKSLVNLTEIEVNLKHYEDCLKDLKNAIIFNNKATFMYKQFLSSRDSTLKNLYDSVRDRFVELYKILHRSDEEKFTAIIEPDGAGLNFEVDFYENGSHPPHALHSEGHQDSMGVCLYLALSEKLTKGVIDLTILDDVVMSVDSDHRRELCKLFSQALPSRQLLITSHDKTWASQLRMENVVTSKNYIELYNWNLATGPQINNEADVWERIEEDLSKNDVSSAAQKLRRFSEQYFGIVCDSLQAPVKYKLNGRWELGDFLPASYSAMNKLLKKAKNSANSWNQGELISNIEEFDSIISQIYKRTNAEQWGINASVHYNNWLYLEKPDFLPIKEAFIDLINSFQCNRCGGILFVSTENLNPVSLRCNCGQINFNLVEKSK